MSNTVLTQQETERLLQAREDRLTHRKYQRSKKGIKYRSKWDIYADILKHLMEFPVSGIKRARSYGSYMDGGYGTTKKWLSSMQDLKLIDIQIIPRYSRDTRKLVDDLRATDSGVNMIRYPLMILKITEKGRTFLDLYHRLHELLAEQ